MNEVEKLNRIRKTKPTKYETLTKILNYRDLTLGEFSHLGEDGH